MVRRQLNGSVELRDITDARGMEDLTTLYLSETTIAVQDIALIADIEEITAVGPDTVVVLSNRAAMGSWMLSAALRYAWERRASALIVPEISPTVTAVELARRLDVSLLSSPRDPTRLALDVALQIGVARAGTLARIQTFAERISRVETFAEAMEAISGELGGSSARIETSGATIDGADPEGAAPPPGENAETRAEVTVPIYASGEAPFSLVASVQTHGRDYAEQVLQTAVPSVRALLNESRLQAIRDSLPPITITALTGEPRIGLIDDPSHDALAALSRWPISGSYIAVCVLATDRERLGAAVHQVWRGIFSETPLARIVDGWLAFVPVLEDDHERLVATMRSRFERVRALGLRVGLSRRRQRPEHTVEAVREAWFAARLAGEESPTAAGGASGVLEFTEISAGLLPRLLPGELAVRLANTLLPRLMADPAADEVIEAVVGYLSCRGSVSGAARLLGVHRNTLQTRLRRAEELGVSLSEPEQLLATHMLLTGLAGRRPA